MKKLLFLSFAALFAVSVCAKPVDRSTAIRVAQNFAKSQVKMVDYSATIVYTHTMPESGIPAMYAINVGNSAFVLVAADDIAHPVLGYSMARPWPTAYGERVTGSLPSQVADFLDDLARQIEAAVTQLGEQDNNAASEWQRLSNSNFQFSIFNLPDSIGPLLTTTWDQGQYYNALCPEDANGPAGHVWTGCVATAMAQIVNYWGYPVNGRGTHSYNSNYGTLTVNYDSANYDYANMPNQLTTSSTLQEVQAVAKLIRDCGVSVNMQYLPTESGAQAFDIRGALTNYFIFDPYLKYTDKEFWVENEWTEMIKNNLAAEKPVLYSGSGNNMGHMFVCDGYNSSNFFHLNYGWSGACDGWFLLSAVTPNAFYDFSSSQSAIVDIMPDEQNSTILYAQQSFGQHSVFRVSDPVNFYGVMENNSYPFRGGYMYSGGHIFTFISTDTTKQIVLYVMDEVGIETFFYDGQTTDDSLIRSFINYAGYFINPDYSPIVTTNSALTVKLESAAWNYGNHFLISLYNGCNIVSGLNSIADTAGVHLEWDSCESCTGYQVEYGPKGFRQGEGTTLSVTDNEVTINGMPAFVKYDFYVRSVCGIDIYSPWCSPISDAVTRPYWTEVVTTQPDGFVVDSNNNVIISTPEGLAWLARITNYRYVTSPEYFEGKTVAIVSDINMGANLWEPIKVFRGNLDGNGHKVDSIISISNQYVNGGGLIENLYNGVVKNVSCSNCFISSNTTSLAGIINYADSSLVCNCTFTGSVTSTIGPAAGIICDASNSDIINCAVIGNITSNGNTSGLCASLYQSKLRNSYSSVTLSPQGIGAGSVCARNPQSVISNCYANKMRSLDYSIGGTTYEGISEDLTFFTYRSDNWEMQDSIHFENGYYINLVEVLNKGIEKFNIPGLRMWMEDTSGSLNRLPVLSDEEYTVSCPNINNVILNNVVSDTNYGLEVGWDENGNAIQWEIRCFKLLNQTFQTVDTIGVFLASNNPDTLWGLEEGVTYVLQVRPVCDSTSHGAWSDRYTHVFDRPYWNEIVTSQPQGYAIGVDGNITISSEEGLAWLNSVINGDNNQQADNMQGKIINLACDINIGQYKWKTINNFRGTFNGGNHTIEGLYVRETADNCGFFANTFSAKILNLTINNAVVFGHNNVATLCGGDNYYLNVYNCKVNATIDAYSNSGGVVSSTSFSRIDNCSSEGSVNSSFYGSGGIVYSAYDTYVRNCYSKCLVSAEMLAGGIIGGNSMGCFVENCYSAITLNCSFYGGGISGSGSMDIRNCYTTLNVPEASDYLVNNQSPIGIIVGVNSSVLFIDNVFYPSNHGIPLVGTHEPTEINCSLIDTMGYSLNDSTFSLSSSVIINNVGYYTLLDVLNAWVYAYDTLGVYCPWVADTANENDGFPVFGERHCINVSSSDSLFAYDNYIWHENVYTTSTELIDTLLTIDGCDSIVTHHLVVNHRPAGAMNNNCLGLKNPVNFTYTGGSANTSWSGSSGHKFSVASTCNYIGIDFNVDHNIQAQYLESTNNTEGCNITLENGMNTREISRDINGNLDHSRQFVIKGAGYDPETHYHLSYLPPDTSFTSSIRLGNYCGYAGGEMLKYEMSVIPDNALVTLWYAMSLQNGAHGASGNPEFIVAFEKNIGTESNPVWQYLATDTLCFKRTTPTSSSDIAPFYRGSTGTQTSSYGVNIYLPWQKIMIDLSNYMYQNIRIKIVSSDCAYSAHYALSYFAGDCQSVNIQSLGCSNDTVKLEAPKGAISYEWYSSKTGVLPENQRGNIDNYQLIVVDTIGTVDIATAQFININTGDTMAQNTIMCVLNTNLNGVNPITTKHYIDVTKPVFWDVYESACESYSWRGDTYTVGGDYLQMAPTANGCDSTLRLHLIVNNPVHIATTETACDSYTWNGTVYTTSGNYTYSHQDANGCMQLDTLHLTVKYSTSSDTIAMACESFTWWNTNYTNSTNDATHSFTNVVGCDSTVTLHLTINNPVHTATTETACETYTWNGTAYTASGNYNYTHIDNNGCTQVDTLHLTINNPVHTATTETACETYTWNGIAYTASGNYNYTHHDNNGCTQVDTLHLTINNPVHISTTETACEAYTWNGIAYTASGNYNYTHIDNNGCTQVDTLHLTINNPVHTSTTETACETYTWNGTAYTASGNYIYTHIDNNGCTQVDTLHLTINNPVHTVTTETACETYTWNEIAYTTSGNYTYTHLDNNGCTQIDTLHLTINNPVHISTTETACEAYTWNGIAYTASGNYNYTHLDNNGCTQVDTLHLTVNYNSTGDTTATACDGFIWWNTNYTNSTDLPTHVYTNAAGCDSIVTLHLTINYSVTMFDTLTIDSNELPYDYYGNTINDEGDYTFNGTTVAGCDSTTYLNVVVNQVGIFDIQNSESEIQLYPNPTGGLLTVAAEGLKSIEVLDVVGRKLVVHECLSDNETIDMSTLPNGAYALRIVNYGTTYIRKVVKK